MIATATTSARFGVPDAVLLKPSALSRSEYEVMKRHAVIGETLCGELHSLAAVRPIVRHRHDLLSVLSIARSPTMTSAPNTKPSPRILVVDDEEPIRQIARRFLEADGYQVTEASNGLEAIALLRHGPPPDLLMVDFQMPDVNGDELVRHVRGVTSDLKVLYVTGHVSELLDEHPALRDWEAFLEKPFTAIGLLEAVSLLLYGTLTKGAVA